MSFFKKHLKKFLIAIIFLVGIFITFKIFNKPNDQKFDSKKEILTKAQKKDLIEKITLAGSIDAAAKAELKFQTSGQLAWVGVKIGDKVKKYQSIASLNKDQLKKQLQVDFNNYQSALTTFDDTQDLYKDEKENLILNDEMKRILTRSQNTLNNSVINYELSDLTIKYSNLFSPIAGIIVAVDQPNPGVNITPANNIASVVDPQSIFFKSQIDQEDVVRIKVGDKAQIKIDSFPDQTFDSEIIYISLMPISGQTSTVYEVRFKINLDNNNLNYRLGMDGDVDIILKEITNTLTLPIESIYQDVNENYIYTIDQDKNLIKKIVKTGIETDTEIEILEGVTEDDQIVVQK
jgi:macrolide-specific efflux system membrane fusion protein